MTAMHHPHSGLVLLLMVHQYGLLGVLSWTVGLAALITAAYYLAKDRLGRRSSGGTPGALDRQGPSQVRVFGLFLMIAVLLFALLLATHFVPAT